MQPAPKPRQALTDAELLLRKVGGGLLGVCIVVWGAVVLTMLLSDSGRKALEAWTRGSLMPATTGAFGVAMVLFLILYLARWRSWAVLQRHDCMFCPYCAYWLRDTTIPGPCPECGGKLHDREFVRKHWELIYDPVKHRSEWRNMDGG